MDDSIRTTLAVWGNFYQITGSAAAALTGLQFVVQTLLASDSLRPPGGDPEAGIGAFGSPTVVHFTISLLISAMMSAPWPAYPVWRSSLGVLGAGALVYSAIVLRRARRQRSYVPVAEDWIWHFLLPVAAYAAVLVAAVLLGDGAAAPAFVVAAATLLLLCIGIHNAWDTVTFLTIHSLRRVAPENVTAPTRANDSKPQKRRRR